jgi:hypothetical protein
MEQLKQAQKNAHALNKQNTEIKHHSDTKDKQLLQAAEEQGDL